SRQGSRTAWPGRTHRDLVTGEIPERAGYRVGRLRCTRGASPGGQRVMVSQAGAGEVRTSMTMNLQLSRGRHGAAARLEVHERPAGRVGLLALRGWVGLCAARGIERALDDLAARGVSRLVVDCSQLLHADYRLVPRLADALLAF